MNPSCFPPTNPESCCIYKHLYWDQRWNQSVVEKFGQSISYFLIPETLQRRPGVSWWSQMDCGCSTMPNYLWLLGWATTGPARLENNRAGDIFLLSNHALSSPEVNAVFTSADPERNSNVRISAWREVYCRACDGSCDNGQGKQMVLPKET